MATAKSEAVIEIKPIQIVKTQIRIVGDTPLIMHCWSEKAKRMMLEAQLGIAKGKKKQIRNPVDDFIQSMYWMAGKPEYPEGASDAECTEAFETAIRNGATFGFPATAFKQAANSAAYRLGWVKNQMGLRGAFFIEADDPNGLVKIDSDTPEMREDMVRVGMGSADLRYRAQFNHWCANLNISYNAASEYGLDVVVNALNAAGFTVGIGEWRAERDGNFGRFHVATV